jgi:hypothetical protein
VSAIDAAHVTGAVARETIEMKKRYTVAAGRQIYLDGKPFVSVGREGDANPSDADEITHILASCLNRKRHIPKYTMERRRRKAEHERIAAGRDAGRGKKGTASRSQTRSTWKGPHETGHFAFQGRTFSAGGASVDAESGRITGYPTKKNGGYVLTTWGGEVIGPIHLVKTWKQNVHGSWRKTDIYAWRIKYQGRTFTGRNGGEGMHLRLKHATARSR